MSESAEYVAPTYLLTSIRSFADSITYRMLADGIAMPDIDAAADAVQVWDQWLPFWIDRARRYADAAEQSAAAGYSLTAAEHFARASLCAHYGQFLAFSFPTEKRAAVQLKVDLYRRGAPRFARPAESIEVGCGSYSVPAYLRLPSPNGPHPCVVLVGGLDAAKEDAHRFAGLCLNRGLATLTFDGPGQGETFYRGTALGADFTDAITAVIDYLESRPEVDRRRIGILGRSTGGFLAPKAAALDKRIRACVAWGAMFDLANFDSIPPLVKDGFQFATRSRDWAEAKEAMTFVNLKAYAGEIECPLFIVHGGKDNITPLDNAHRLARAAKGRVDLVISEDSVHCNHDVAHLVRPAMADWLAKHLRVT